ncbi:unnamed protein product [Protopolystoma xenopodis]|uniref:Uncharacterized protein n=1 Tax=Protopolystoma xenopodis TaxID=117903 RepID=A0A448XCN3_9PLAT|nr:unnamed protein product [Protopolystoma xenopodis]
MPQCIRNIGIEGDFLRIRLAIKSPAQNAGTKERNAEPEYEEEAEFPRAFVMAVKTRGMTLDEVYDLTRIMSNHSKTLDWHQETWANRVVDKHSTGGIGDKTSLILAPLTTYSRANTAPLLHANTAKPCFNYLSMESPDSCLSEIQQAFTTAM